MSSKYQTNNNFTYLFLFLHFLKSYQFYLYLLDFRLFISLCNFIINLKIVMQKILLTLTLIFFVAHTRTYPMFKQCDTAWKNDQLGTSSNTICSAGCLMSSASMGLAGTVKSQITPAILNKWLTQNGGYVSGDLFVWASINPFGLTFQGKVGNSEIKSNLDRGNVVLSNVHNGKHWVIAYGYNGDNILINDPNYTTPSYTLSEIVDGQNGVYSVRSGTYYNILEKLKALKNKIK